MMPDTNGNAAQTRVVSEQIADAMFTRFYQEHPELKTSKVEIPPPLKWAGGVIAALFTMGVGAMAVWLVGTVNTMQVTLARMDERQSSQNTSQDSRFTDHERRIQNIEAVLQQKAAPK